MRFWTLDEAQAELPRVRRLLDTIGAAVAELDDLGIVVRDLSAQLIDFPSVDADGEVRYLCWRADDGDEIGWWHHPDEGFAGRKEL